MFKIIMRAGDIPLESKVTKKTGQQVLLIRDRIHVFNEAHTKQEIKADAGARFLVNDKGDANAIGVDTELVWLAEDWQLRDLIDPHEDK